MSIHGKPQQRKNTGDRRQEAEYQKPTKKEYRRQTPESGIQESGNRRQNQNLRNKNTGVRKQNAQ
jgi:hypothetical protein